MLKAQGSSRIHQAPTNSKGQTMELINVDLLEETIQFLDPVLKLMKIAGLIPRSFSTSSLRDKGRRLDLLSSKQQVAYTFGIWTGFSIIMVAYFFVLFRGGWQALGFSQMDVATVGVYSVLTFSVLLMVWKDHSALLENFTIWCRRQTSREAELSTAEQGATSGREARRIRLKIHRLLVLHTWIPYVCFNVALFFKVFEANANQLWFSLGVVIPLVLFMGILVISQQYGAYLLLTSIGLTRTRIRRATWKMTEGLTLVSRTATDFDSSIIRARGGHAAVGFSGTIGEILTSFQFAYNQIEDDHDQLMELLYALLGTVFFSKTCLLIATVFFSSSAYVFGSDVWDIGFYVKLASMGFISWNLVISALSMAEGGEELIAETRTPLDVLEHVPSRFEEALEQDDIDQVAQLTIRLRAQPISADVSGVFTVQRSLFINVASQIVTYVVVLLQFRQMAPV